MEKKENAPVFVVALAVVTFLGFACGGIAWFNLDETLRSQGHDLGEARRHLLALDQAVSTQRKDLNDAWEQLAPADDELADAQEGNQALAKQLTETQSKLRENEAAAETHFLQGHAAPVMAPGIPARVSVEDQLRAEGKRWERAEGQITLGSYVQDILEGRSGQPNGRGSIAKVMSIAVNDQGRSSATADFGRGYVVGIDVSELSLIRFLGPDLR